MNRILLHLLLLCTLSALLACGSDSGTDNDSDPDEGKPTAEMVGRWTYQSVTADGSAADLATVLEWDVAAVSANVQILANGAYVYEETNPVGAQLWFESGFVFVEGARIEVNAQLDGDGPAASTTGFTFMLADGVMTLLGEATGPQHEFTLTDPLATIQAYATGSNATNLLLRDLTEAGVEGAVAGNLPGYRTAIAAAGTVTDLDQLQSFIGNVNGMADALEFEQGLGFADVPIEANGEVWFSFNNAWPNHQISVTTVDDIDLRLDVFHPGYVGVTPPNHSVNEFGQGPGVSEVHDTNTTETLPNGVVFLRVVELSGNGGLFGIGDSD